MMIGNSHIVKDNSHKIHIEQERQIFDHLPTSKAPSPTPPPLLENRKGVFVVHQLKITPTTSS